MTQLAIGTVQFGLDYGIQGRTKVPMAEIVKMLAAASENGPAMLDTAAAYGDSETVLGEAMRRCGRSFEVVSKISGGGPGLVREELSVSLQRLGIERLYGCLFHNFARLRSHLDSYRDLEACRRDGMAGKIGVSLYYPEEWDFLREQGITPELVQIPYNLFDRRFERVMTEMRQAGTEIHVRSVFLQGLFGMAPESLSAYFAPVRPALARLGTLAGTVGATPIELAFRLVSGHPAVDRVVIGMVSTAELRDNRRLLALPPLDDALRTELAALECRDENMILPFNWPK